MKIKYGKGSVNHLRSLLNVAVCLAKNGEYQKAKAKFAEVYESLRDSAGEFDEDTLKAQHNLAVGQLDCSEYEDSLRTISDCIEKRNRVLGKTHPLTLTSLHIKSIILQESGKLNEALELTKEIYETKIETLGENHISTLNSLEQLGLVYTELGNYKTSLEIYELLNQKRVKEFGKANLASIKSKSSLAQAYRYNEDFERAESAMCEAIEDLELVLEHPDSHPQYLTCKHNLAVFWNDQKRYEESFDLFCWVEKKRNIVLGKTALQTLRTQYMKCLVLKNLNENEQALSVSETCIEGFLNMGFDEDHHEILRVKQVQGMILKNMGRDQDALRCYQKLYEKRCATLGQNHVDTLSTKQKLDELSVCVEQN